MVIKQFELWLVDLNPQIGTETGKTRPVLIVQTNILNSLKHASTIICPLTTNVKKDAEILRVHLNKGEGGINRDSDIMIDQVRAIDNKRLIKKLGKVPETLIDTIRDNLAIVLDLS